MSLISNIRTSLSKVGRKFEDGFIEYRTLTSAPNANPRTYSSWLLLPYSRCVEFGESQQQDQEIGVWYRMETCQLRVPYEAGVNLSIRDQVRQGPTAIGASTSNQVWSIREQGMSAAGAVQSYNLYRKTPIMTNPRPGGV